MFIRKPTALRGRVELRRVPDDLSSHYAGMLYQARARQAERLLSSAMVPCSLSMIRRFKFGGYWEIVGIEPTDGVRYDAMRLTLTVPRARVRLRWRYNP